MANMVLLFTIKTVKQIFCCCTTCLKTRPIKHPFIRHSLYTNQRKGKYYRLPYFPDRITHHAVMNILEPIFMQLFTSDTYSCIKKRGIHAAALAVKKALRNEPATRYCLKLDIKKFYPNIDHQVLKHLLRRKFKDEDLLWLLDEIIDSAPGLPIGNYLSQYFANFYLTYFDHWIKKQKALSITSGMLMI
jgi:RNA-directed DNA polymerase